MLGFDRNVTLGYRGWYPHYWGLYLFYNRNTSMIYLGLAQCIRNSCHMFTHTVILMLVLAPSKRLLYWECVFVVWAGLRPTPRTWLKWNMKKLEPANIKMREELLNQAKNKKSNTTCRSFARICVTMKFLRRDSVGTTVSYLINRTLWFLLFLIVHPCHGRTNWLIELNWYL